MAHTFLKVKGISIGKSLNEPAFEEKAREILETCEKKKIPLVLPVDLRVAEEIKADSTPRVVSIQSIPEGVSAGDVGPQTLELYKKYLKQAKTVFWNGPLGVAEIDAFSKGTEALAKFLGDLDSITIVGGGDSTAALKKLGLEDKVTYISTGGGASLEYIEKGFLPGIEALSSKN
jgi:3-phosphoglycerate kinase